MGLNTVGAAGVSLPPPQALFPVTISNNPQFAATNRLSLPPGGDVLIPSGTWFIQLGQYSLVQALDPVTQTWLPYFDSASGAAMGSVSSDGQNYRIINPTGFPIGAVVSASGSGFTSAPVVTATPGGASFTAIVGGGVSALNCAAAGSGVGYLVPPIINIAAPPSPGVQATAVCAISGGAISSFTIINAGAGYTSAPAVVAIPQNSDTNFQSGNAVTKNAVLTSQISFAGSVTAVLLDNEGNNPLGAAPALSFAGGGGSGAAATAIQCVSITGITVTTGGSGYASPAQITTVGGSISTQTSGLSLGIQNPAVSTLLLPTPRPAYIGATQGSSSGVQVGVIVDGGMFTATPTAIALPQATGLATLAAFGLTMGGNNDTVFVTPQ